MIAQRVGTTALRRVAAHPSSFFNQNISKLALASTLSATQKRPVATTKLTPADGAEILASQRLKRPVSPNLGIYDMKQTWFNGSAWTRITGAIFSGSLYVYGTAYLVAPLLGWHLESASLAAAFASMPIAVKGGLKFLIAWPFTFHAMNGVRHLVWDLGYGFVKKNIIAQGWYLWGASIVGGLYLAFLF